MKEACKKFIELIIVGRYFEAHEVLEEVWFPRRFEENEEVFLIKGFINASVAFELNKRGRIESAKKTWRVYLKYRPILQNISRKECAPIYLEVDRVLKKEYENLAWC